MQDPSIHQDKQPRQPYSGIRQPGRPCGYTYYRSSNPGLNPSNGGFKSSIYIYDIFGFQQLQITEGTLRFMVNKYCEIFIPRHVPAINPVIMRKVYEDTRSTTSPAWICGPGQVPRMPTVPLSPAAPFQPLNNYTDLLLPLSFSNSLPEVVFNCKSLFCSSYVNLPYGT